MVMAASPEETVRSADILPGFCGRSGKVRGSAWEIREIRNLELYGNQCSQSKRIGFFGFVCVFEKAVI